MNFRDQLQHLVESVPGATASTLMEFDGIAIDTFHVGSKPPEFNTLITEYAAMIHRLKHTEDLAAQVGAPQEVIIRTDQLIAAVQVLTDDYFLAVLLNNDGYLGKARYKMRILRPYLLKELK